MKFDTLGQPVIAVVGLDVDDGGATVIGADPTGVIGLAAVNGSAPTFMRSDAAPPLSQAIAPTWTGTHIFNGPNVFMGVTAPSVAGEKYRMHRATDGITLMVTNNIAGSGNSLLGNFSNMLDADFNISISHAGAAAKFARIGPSVGVDLRLATTNTDRLSISAAGVVTVLTNDLRTNQINGQTTVGNQLTSNDGGLPYGAWYVTGSRGGWYGIAVNDGARWPCFMADGSNRCGVYIMGPAYWSWHDDGTYFEVTRSPRRLAFGGIWYNKSASLASAEVTVQSGGSPSGGADGDIFLIY